jgi:hypothetical protein
MIFVDPKEGLYPTQMCIDEILWLIFSCIAMKQNKLGLLCKAQVKLGLAKLKSSVIL